MEPKWLTEQIIRAIHGQALAESGGAPGLRDAGLLDSALERPRNVYAYGENPSLFRLAAIYCNGIVRNHPFIDGNKRAGLLAGRAFLFLNGYLFEPDESDEVKIIVGLAAGEVELDILAQWFADFSSRKRD